MSEKKSYKLNCDVCDTRKVREDMFEEYEDISICADLLLVNERSKAILDKYPICLQADTVLDVEDAVDLQVQNGMYEINSDQELKAETALIVNGALKIAPGTENVLKKYVAIIANGEVSCPKSLASYLNKMIVNGVTEVYPDDSILLKKTAVLDKYFAVKVRENSRYYAARRVVMADADIDIAGLKRKQVHFMTPKLLIAECLLKDAVSLFDEEVELTVIPDGCSFVKKSAVLDESLVCKYGKKLFIDGNLTLNESSTQWLSELEYLSVQGEVSLTEEQKGPFLKKNPEYATLKVTKGTAISNKLSVKVDGEMLKNSPKGLYISRCVKVLLDQAVTSRQIRDFLQFENCTEIVCTKEQMSSVAFVSENVRNVNTDEDGGCEKKCSTKETRILADRYVL